MLEGLKQKPESFRQKVALSGAALISLLIFSGWFYSKGYFGYSTTTATQNEVTEAPSTAKSPLENTKVTFNSVFDQISREYQALKDSIASVLVPFITGIDVYNKGDSK